MKGIVFTEFIEFVESRFDQPTADGIMDDGPLASGGAYTAVGTYDPGEMVELLTRLSRRTQMPCCDLLRAYGEHLFTVFAEQYSQFFADTHCALDFLMTVENYIHIEVRKLYPDAELPHLTHQRRSDGELDLIYESNRGLADLAEGLIRGCIRHYGNGVALCRQDLSSDGAAGPDHRQGPGRRVLFRLTRDPTHE